MLLDQSEIVSSTWNVVTKTHDYALASLDEIAAIVWRHETTLEGIKNSNQFVAEVARHHPKGIALLAVISEVVPMPSSEARKALSNLMSTHRLVRCSAVIMEGTGFRAAAVRSVVTGLALMSHHEYPYRICDVEGAVKMYTDV
ncbi:MAG: hypothetical protein ACM3ZE_18900, partial [Myxococcales bacterium]